MTSQILIEVEVDGTSTVVFAGLPGRPGTKWINGSDDPEEEDGILGDYYLNNTSKEYFEKTDFITWTSRGVLAGASGVAWNDITGRPSTFAPSAHTHPTNEVTGLDATLSAKADLVGGVIPTSQIPAIAVKEFLGDVANQVAMLLLTGQKGDWCFRSDVNKDFLIVGNDPTLIGSWRSLDYPASSVISVNGQTGTVVLSKSDIGLGNVPNVNTTNPDNISWTATRTTVSDDEKATWNAKQDLITYTPEDIAWKIPNFDYFNPLSGDGEFQYPCAQAFVSESGVPFRIIFSSEGQLDFMNNARNRGILSLVFNNGGDTEHYIKMGDTDGTGNETYLLVDDNVQEIFARTNQMKLWTPDGTMVLKPITGWGAPTGPMDRGTFEAGIANVNDIAKRLSALITDLRAKKYLTD